MLYNDKSDFFLLTNQKCVLYGQSEGTRGVYVTDMIMLGTPTFNQFPKEKTYTHIPTAVLKEGKYYGDLPLEKNLIAVLS